MKPFRDSAYLAWVRSLPCALCPRGTAPNGVDAHHVVARGQGRHAFSHTYEEHLENIRRVRAVTASNDSLAQSARDSVASAGTSLVTH